MRKVLFLLLLCAMLIPVRAAEFTAPTVPSQNQALMPQGNPSFGEGLLYIAKTAFKELQPELTESCRACISIIGIAMLVSVLKGISGKAEALVEMAGVLSVATVLLGNANTLIHLASQTVQEVSNYGKLLLPVMTASVAAQGGTASSAALYTGTAFFDTLLSTVISSFLIPMVYMFLALTVGAGLIGEDLLKRIRELLKWSVGWCLKTILYVFTGYLSISGVIAGGTDKTALKAAKLTISGMVPVVGGIMSDASETILVGAGVVKGAVGLYGMLAVIAIVIVPFLRIGAMYLMLKLTIGICGVFSSTKIIDVLQGFTDAMGFLLGMAGTVSMLFMISIVCFLKGVSGS